MEWEVEFTDEFSDWWNGLTEAEQVDVNTKVILLQKIGPSLSCRSHSLFSTSEHERTSDTAFGKTV